MSEHTSMQWYAIYTNYNAEQTLNQAFLNFSERNGLGYDSYLPLLSDVQQWQNRTRTSYKPLFRNYLFVKHDEQAFFKVKNLKGFNHYIRTGLTPSVIPEDQMQIIQKVANHQVGEPRQASDLTRGKPVKVCRGEFAGFQGVLLKDVDDDKLAIEIKSLRLYLCVQLPADDVALLA